MSVSENNRKIDSNGIYINIIDDDDYYNYSDTNNINTFSKKITKGRLDENKSREDCGDSDIYIESTKYTKYIQSPTQSKNLNFYNYNTPLSLKTKKSPINKEINKSENSCNKPLIKYFTLNSLNKLNNDRSKYLNVKSVYNNKLLHVSLNNAKKKNVCFSPIRNNINKMITAKNYNYHFNYYSPENNISNSDNQLSSDRRLNTNFSSDYIKFPINKKNKTRKSNNIFNCINLKRNLKAKKTSNYFPLMSPKLSSKREDKKPLTSRQGNWVNRLYTKELEKQKQKKTDQNKKRKLILAKNNNNNNNNIIKKVGNNIKTDKIKENKNDENKNDENKNDEDEKFMDEIEKNAKLFENIIFNRKKNKKNKEISIESDKKFIKKKSRNNKFDIDKKYEIKKLDKESIDCLIQNDNHIKENVQKIEKTKRENIINKLIREMYMKEESIGEVIEEQEQDDE